MRRAFNRQLLYKYPVFFNCLLLFVWYLWNMRTQLLSLRRKSEIGLSVECRHAAADTELSAKFMCVIDVRICVANQPNYFP